LYTGDINLRKTRLLDAAHVEHLHADILLTESTYGGDNDIFPSERKQLGNMLKSINETIQKRWEDNNTKLRGRQSTGGSFHTR